jgi:hypothetical protein
MKKLTIGDVTITSIIERDGPWRRPEEMFPAYDPEIGRRHLAELDPEVFDPASGKMVITYQTYVVRTPKHTILIDTCTGEDKGYPPPMDFPKKPWLDGFAAEGLRFEDIDYVFCTHLHIDHSGWNTVLRNGRWVPTFPKAKYIFHKCEYAAWEESTKRGETRARAAAMFGGSTASQWSRPVKLCSSTTISRSTTRSGSRRRRAIYRAIAASISARAGSTRWSSATSCIMPCNAASRAGRRSSTGTRKRQRDRASAFSAKSPEPAPLSCRSISRIRPRDVSRPTARDFATTSCVKAKAGQRAPAPTTADAIYAIGIAPGG